MSTQAEGESPIKSNIPTSEKGFYAAADYGNEFTSQMMGIRLLDRDGPTISGMLREGLREVSTFTEYNNRTHHVNTDAMMRPEVQRLDEIADNLRGLADSPLPIQELRERIIRLVSKGHGIIKGGQREQEILKEFGLEVETPETS